MIVEYKRNEYAGFWNRLVAFWIDLTVVSLIVFPFALLIGLFFPNAILVEVPFELFTTTTTVSRDIENNESIEKDELLGLLINYYKTKVEIDEETGNCSTTRDLIDPVSKSAIKKTTSTDIEFHVIFIYWILLEASVWQASLGKKIMGLQVITEDGERPDIFQCASRNLLKVLSGIILFFGFLMAGWTDKKQTLHDKISNTLIVKKDHNNVT